MNDEDLSQLWMVPYADLMSCLVLLFMSLFAYSFQNKGPEVQKALARIETDVSAPTQATAAEERLAETDLAVRIKEELDGLKLKDFGVEVDARSVKLTLPSPVLFAEGSVRLSPEADAVLAPLATLLARYPNPVLVEGHTDDVRIVGGRFRSNFELSAGRSFSVIESFLARGLAPGRFHARGYGEHRPVASNATAAGRAANRRIEISLVRELREPGGPLP
ncbi:MAG: OmpA family protein [Elusimicrobiota bacterium]|nr:OmpA family protein [Elusimicrobiota bacterium]